jgi:hypothetical protein
LQGGEVAALPALPAARAARMGNVRLFMGQKVKNLRRSTGF